MMTVLKKIRSATTQFRECLKGASPLKIATGVSLTLASLFSPLHADTIRYVGQFIPNAVDDTLITTGESIRHGSTPLRPWATTAYAMAHAPCPNVQNGNSIIYILGSANTSNIYTGAVSLNPVNKVMSGGGRYFIYGDLRHIGWTRINPTGGITYLEAPNTTWAGFDFQNGLTIRTNPTGCIVGSNFIRCRLQDSVKTSIISAGSMVINASNVYVSDVYMNPVCNQISIGRDDTNVRKLQVEDWLNNVTFNSGGSGTDFLTAGNQKTCSDVGQAYYRPACGSTSSNDPWRSIYVDSLHIWMSNITGNINAGSNNKGVSLYHCTNLDMRDTKITLGHANTVQTRPFALRDSIDNAHFNRDTIICIANPSVLTAQGFQWFENVGRSGNRVGNPNVDSSYFQVATMEWVGPLSGVWTYNTFITRSGFQINDNTVRVDSLNNCRWDHNNFIQTNSTQLSTVAFGNLPVNNQSAHPYAWPTVPTDGNTMVFTNNIIFRRDSSLTNPTDQSWAGVEPLVTWGRVGEGAIDEQNGLTFPKRDVAKKIATNWNLYASGNQLKEQGDFSIGWVSGRYPGQDHMSSRPGPTSIAGGKRRGLFKFIADSSATGLAAAAASAYDSNSVYCYPAVAGFVQWDVDNNFAGIWTTGAKLDLRLTATSPARNAGSGGSSIGARSYIYGVPFIQFVSDSVLAADDRLAIGGATVDTLTLSIHNLGEDQLTGVFSTSPANSYYVSTDAALSVISGGTQVVTIYVIAPSVIQEIGVYPLDITITSNDPVHPTKVFTIYVNRGVYWND